MLSSVEFHPECVRNTLTASCSSLSIGVMCPCAVCGIITACGLSSAGADDPILAAAGSNG
ncbi:hypothetical protein E2562_037395 [Oryza meyeriana var. granulata]|uniref:Uncharacterized protein n=1 Tax=Oryza meyeriana var. granulata TaxID=110450 RepID=A0A6G1DB08_9ORYZ|nr:hypothetical protein E2562_037395 [Oryza meyeriana var. granulata]